MPSPGIWSFILTTKKYQRRLVDAEIGAPTATLLNKFDSDLATRSALTLDDMDDAVTELASQGYHVVIDAPGKEGDQVSTLCLLSDLVIIPLCVSEQDLLQTVAIMNLVLRQQRRSKEQKPAAAIVFTRTLKFDIASPSVRENLEKHGIPIATSEIRERIAIKRNICVMRDPRFKENDGPANDFIRLADEIIFPFLNHSTSRSVNE